MIHTLIHLAIASVGFLAMGSSQRICADNWGGYALGDELFGRSGKLLWFELAPKLSDAFEIAA